MLNLGGGSFFRLDVLFSVCCIVGSKNINGCVENFFYSGRVKFQWCINYLLSNRGMLSL